jgi:hypothetical protein
MERVKKNDPVAICQMGKKHKDKDDYGKHSNILQRPLSWVIWKRVLV